MPDASIIQIIEAYATLLDTMAGVTIYTDRDNDEPLAPEERPGIVIRVVDIALDERPEGDGTTAQVHSARMAFDFYEDIDVTDNITFQHANRIAEAAALMAGDWTLDGKLYWNVLAGVTANSDNVPDAGVATLESDIKWLTPTTDWFTILPA